MDFKLLFFLVITSQFVCIDGETEMDDVLYRLDVIDTKLAKVDVLLAGFEKLCESIHQIKSPNNVIYNEQTITCDEESKRTGDCLKQEDDVDHADDSIEIISNDKDTQEMLQFVSVQSEGVTDGIVNISVVYIADKTYVPEWFITMKNSSGITSNGVTYEKVKDNQRIEFTSSVILNNAESVDFLILTINSQTYNAYLDINTPMLTVKGKELFQPVENMILDYKPRESVPGHTLEMEGFKAPLKVTKGVVDKISRQNLEIQASMDIFNWTTSPPEYSKKWFQPIREQDNISVSVRNDSENELEIKIENNLAKFGGLIKIYFSQDTDSYDYIRGFSYGVQIKFVNDEIGDLFPYGTIGLRKNGAFRYVRGSTFSVLCMAFGEPIPRVIMSMKTNDGYWLELEPDYKIVLEPFVYTVINYFLNKSSIVDKTILCEATDANTTVTEETQYLPFIEVKIDNKKTRLVKNTKENVVVSCKATGSPVPDLELRSENENGPDLLQDRKFSHRLTRKKLATKVTLVISPRDKNIRSVICVATQFGNQTVFTIKKAKEIRILPPRGKHDDIIFNVGN